MIVASCSSHASDLEASANLQTGGRRLKALIFDVDGTLYKQGRVRGAMVYRLLRAHLTSPRQGLMTWRALSAYREAQEELRATPTNSGDIASAQLLLAAAHLGVSTTVIGACVARWMEQEPLVFLAGSRRKGIVELLEQARSCGLRLAALSDYPANQKLAAMGLAGYFDVVVSAQDPDVQRFKPDPRGLAITLERLEVRTDEVVYIGDRADVDAAAAVRAGIPHIILRHREDFSQLSDLLISRG